MGRSPCCDELGLKKGPWTPEEDEKLREYVQKNGHGSWRRLPKLAGLNRCGKSCRLRWTNYLRPDIKRGKFTEEEERLITQLHSHHGNKWSTIATSLPGRTDNEIKNYWNTHLRKKLLQMGIDPVTHQPRADLNLLSSLPKLLAAANLGSLTSRLDNSLQLQADAAHLIKLHLVHNLVQALTRSPTPNLNLMSLFGSPVLGNHQLTDIMPLSRQLDISLVNGSPILQNLSNQGLQNLASSLHPSPESSRSADAGDLMAAPADDLSSESMMMTTVCGANSCAFSTSGSAPSLVSASPEYMNKTQTMSAISFDGSIDTPISATLEAWDSLDLDDLDKDLGYWKEILGQLSS